MFLHSPLKLDDSRAHRPTGQFFYGGGVGLSHL